MDRNYTLNQIERVRELAESGMTRADIRLLTGIGFRDIERIGLMNNIRFRRGHSEIARDTVGAPRETKIRTLFDRYPSARLILSEVLACAGIRNEPGMTQDVLGILIDLENQGYLASRASDRGGVPVYFRAAPPQPAANPEARTKSMETDFERCDDLAGIRQTLAAILTELRQLTRGRSANA